MNKRKIFLHSLNRFRMAGAVIAVMLFAACDDEETMGVRSNGDTICFNLTQQTDEWNELPQSRSMGDTHSEDAYGVDTTYMMKLDHDTPEGKPLYLHVQVTDGIECGGTEEQADAPMTRGTQVTNMNNFHSSFGVCAVTHDQGMDNDSSNPTKPFNLMNNLKVENAKNWQTDVKWPVKSGFASFYAYAPHNSEMNSGNFTVNVAKHSTWEGMELHIQQNERLTAAQSPDLLVSTVRNVTISNGTSIPLVAFQHALAAVKIRSHATEFLGMKLVSLGFLNVYRDMKIRHYYASGSIQFDQYDNGNTGNVYMVQNSNQNVDKNQELIPDGGTFFMIPQTLDVTDRDIYLEIKYAKINNPSLVQTTKIRLNGAVQWQRGKTYTYTLSNSETVPNPEWDYTFEVADGQSEFLCYKFDNIRNIPIKSYSNIRGNANTKKSVDWSWAYSVDNGKTWKEIDNDAPAVDLNAYFTGHKQIPAGSDGTDHRLNTIAKYEEPAPDYNREDELLKSYGELGNTQITPYDLSSESQVNYGKRTTANCYTVNKSGWYCFPVVFGNAIKGGAVNERAYKNNTSYGGAYATFLEDYNGSQIKTPYLVDQYGIATMKRCSLQLLWMDAPNLVTNLSLEFDDIIGKDCSLIKFQVPNNYIRQGNAVIALLSEDRRVIWQWHIWVTPYRFNGSIQPVDQFGRYDTDYTITNKTGKKYIMMGVPVGYCSGNSQVYNENYIYLRFTQKATGTVKQLRLVRTAYKKRSPGNVPTFQYARPCPLPAGIYTANQNWRDECQQKNVTWGDFVPYGRSNKLATEGIRLIGQISYYPFGIRQPLDFISNFNVGSTGYNHWFYNEVRNVWNMGNWRESSVVNVYDKIDKTIFDPSPRGYVLPPGDAFTGFTVKGNTSIEIVDCAGKWTSMMSTEAQFREQFGVSFKTNPEGRDDQTIYIPVTGFRNPIYKHTTQGGDANFVFNAGNICAYWTGHYQQARLDGMLIQTGAINGHGVIGFECGLTEKDGKMVPYIYTQHLQHTADAYGVISVREQ